MVWLLTVLFLKSDAQSSIEPYLLQKFLFFVKSVDLGLNLLLFKTDSLLNALGNFPFSFFFYFL